MTLLSIGDRVEPGIYRLHSRFKRAVNYVHKGRLVSVVDETIGPGPLNIVMRALPAGARERSADFRSAVSRIPDPQNLASLRHARRLETCDTADWKSALRSDRPRGCELQTTLEPLLLEVRPRTVLFAGRRYHFTPRHRYCSTLERPALDPPRFRRNLSSFGRLLRKTAPAQSLAFLLDETRLEHFRTAFERAFTRRIRRGVHRLFHGDLLKAVGDLKGCGPGLTPSGDDFITGLLIGLNFLQKLHGHDLQPVADAVCRAAQGGSLFSNTALELARQGLLFGRVKAVLLALISGNALCLSHATQGLLAVGANSGADLGTGLFMTLREGVSVDFCQPQPKLVGVAEAGPEAMIS